MAPAVWRESLSHVMIGTSLKHDVPGRETNGGNAHNLPFTSGSLYSHFRPESDIPGSIANGENAAEVAVPILLRYFVCQINMDVQSFILRDFIELLRPILTLLRRELYRLHQQPESSNNYLLVWTLRCTD